MASAIAKAGLRRRRATVLLRRAEVRPALDEELREPGVEMRAGELGDLRQRVLDEPRVLVRTVRDERVEDVADCADAGDERDLLAREAGGVAAAVPLLVVRAGDDLGLAHDRRAAAAE